MRTNNPNPDSGLRNTKPIQDSKSARSRDLAPIGGRGPHAAGKLALILVLGFLATANSSASELSIRLVKSKVLDTGSSGTPHIAVNNGATWLDSDCDGTTTCTGVMRFVATNQTRITVPVSTNLDADSGTITFWMRTVGPVNAHPGSQGAMIFDRRTSDGIVIVVQDDGQLLVQAFDSVQSSARAGDGNWHHVAISYQQAPRGATAIYLDGDLAAFNEDHGSWIWPTEPIELGSSHDSFWRSFNGLLDDVRVYNRRLDDQEIYEVYTGALVDTNALMLRFNFDAVPMQVGWSPPSATLQSATKVNGPFTDVQDASRPYLFYPVGESRFFRAVEQNPPQD